MGKISIPHFSIERWGFIFCNTVDRQKENLINFREIDIRKAIKTVDENPTLRTGRESVEYDLYYHIYNFYLNLLLISYIIPYLKISTKQYNTIKPISPPVR